VAVTGCAAGPRAQQRPPDEGAAPGDGVDAGAGHYPLTMSDDAKQPGGFGRFVLALTRVWVPVAIAVAGVIGIVIGHGKTAAAGAGVALVIAALIVWMINWMYRMSVQSNHERDREEEARAYFDAHGRWPDE